jgi:hypothetical protein
MRAVIGTSELVPFTVGQYIQSERALRFVSCSLRGKQPRDVSVRKFSTFVKRREVGENRTVPYSRSKSAPPGTKKPILAEAKDGPVNGLDLNR